MEIRYRRQLVDLVRDLNLPLIGAEIGVAEGFFSADLLRAGMEKLFLVDAWEKIPDVRGDGNFPQHWHDKNFRAAKERVEEFGERAVILKGKSKDMAARVEDESLGLLYIDADHSYEGVMGDLKAWFPKVVRGGVVAGHDYANTAYKVKEAVYDFIKSKAFAVQGYNEEIWSAINLIPEGKVEDAGFYFIKQ